MGTRTPLGPEDDPPGVIADRLRREMQAVIRVVRAKQKLAIDRNTKYYTGLTQQLVPGDLSWKLKRILWRKTAFQAAGFG